MVAAALPLSKLAGLLVKTLAKPLAKRIKHDFSRFPLTQRLLISIGQTTHVVTSRMTIWSAGYKVRSITPLDPEKAMSDGADFLGESIVFFVAGSVVVLEYNLSKAKEKEKEEKRLSEMDNESKRLQAKLNALDARLAALEKVVKSSSLPLALLGGAKYVEPVDVVPIDDRRKGDFEPKPVASPKKSSPSGNFSESGNILDIRTLVEDMEKGMTDPGKKWTEDDEESDENSGEEGKVASDTSSRRWSWWGWWPF